ncbi:hypothetical protein BJX61DRAFT_489897 [Aspergillus egyptiacus]|nr:hypothetical protein BJX61DRAFT_489897 [Aspergillus egyptiacus]
MQVSLLQGGLLLDIAAQHNIIDATGIFYIAHLLSRLMADQPNLIPKADLVLGNCDRINIISLLPPDEPLPKEMSEFIQPYPQTVDRDTLAQFRWYFFHMSPEAIAAIHTEAISHPEDFVASLTTVSVNDALTAFFWQRLTRVRSRLSPSSPTSGQYSEPTTQLTRAADLRRTMKLSPAYMGHMVRTANLRLPVSTVATSSLSYLASALRNCVSEHTTPQAVRSYATLLARTTDKSRILYAGGFNPLTDLSCSSMAHVMVPRFGKGLGVPEFVRRPAAGLLPSGMYVGPGRGGEGVDAMVCLKSSEIEGLMGDEAWSSKIEVVGGNC